MKYPNINRVVKQIKDAKNDANLRRIIADAIQDAGNDDEMMDEVYEISGPYMRPNECPEDWS